MNPWELHLRKVPYRGQTREWRFNPLWTRLTRHEHAEFGVQALALAMTSRQRANSGGPLCAALPSSPAPATAAPPAPPFGVHAN